jgi:hypothetical protein
MAPRALPAKTAVLRGGAVAKIGRRRREGGRAVATSDQLSLIDGILVKSPWSTRDTGLKYFPSRKSPEDIGPMITPSLIFASPKTQVL